MVTVPRAEELAEEPLEIRSFATRYAYFEPARFGDLPGWRADRVGEAWQAFRQSCAALGKRPAWAGPCARSVQVNGSDDESIRRFIEREFTLYQIHNADRSPAGVITGYYEPLLNGSRRYGGKYVYPIYAMPDDLLFLDARALPSDYRQRAVLARLEGRNVKPLATATTGAEDVYTLDLGNAQPDIRDKKIRVRVEGRRIMPYHTRAEIERDRLARAKVLVWVDNPVAAYSMQIQGSGKVRLPDGHNVRLAYAEQNGHPFLPPLQPVTRGAGTADIPLVRGIPLAFQGGQDADAVQGSDRSAEAAPATRGGKGKPPSSGADKEPLAPDVAAVVEALLQGATPSNPQKKAAGESTGRPTGGLPADKDGKRDPAKPAPRPAEPSPGGLPFAPASTFWSDPSYVFFREIPDTDTGPIGALGVPLTAGRSIAVDPRTTPLGFPVFISTTQPRNSETLNRLVLAQDTGGAIRGAVRADYFWGFGANAWAMASRMKENGRMWLLLPKGQQISAHAIGITTRGGAGAGDVECVVPDPDLCVE